MSDFELFQGFDGGEQIDPASFERFKERMKANAAQMKAIQAGEQKQKQKEDKLVKILLKFIRTSRKNTLVLLISRVLEENVPAAFVLSLILLGNEDIQRETGIALCLHNGDNADSTFNNESINKQTINNETANNKDEAMSISGENRQIAHISDMQKMLPLKIRIAIDLWGKNILETGRANPHKILRTIRDRENLLKNAVSRLTIHVIIEYLEENGVSSEMNVLKEFSEFLLNGVIDQLKKQIEGQKELK
ncbi:hypothetical protein HYV57_04355 [Candidatus Peregrinibacteria bacterium]|nr:hypothetical protein [Candidatus Peregrinibacteria bacterium]